METFYLIDFENVHNDGIANIESMTKEEHVHIFSTQNATNIRQDIFWLNGDIKSHLVPMRKAVIGYASGFLPRLFVGSVW